MEQNMNEKLDKGLNIKTRRLIAYIVLIFLTFLCLFWFYVDRKSVV